MMEAMWEGRIGMIVTYGHRLVPDGAQWIMDNSCFGTRYPYPGDDEYCKRIKEMSWKKKSCWFVTAPDVPFDAVGSLDKSRPMFSRIRELGFPVAFVGQDGIEDMDVPWEEFDTFFIGGSTEWKIGPGGRKAVSQALDHGKAVHMGRVNSLGRMWYAKQIGCMSADGTMLRYAPDKNLPKLLKFLDQVNGGGFIPYLRAVAPVR